MLRDPHQDLHDVLEEAYLAQMAAGSGRWFCARRDGHVLAGFAGLDAPTTSRIARLDVERGDVASILTDAEHFFAERNLPWCVALTPYARPSDVRTELRRRRFHLAAEFGIMTLTTAARTSDELGEGVHVREVGPEEAGLFTRLTIEGFGMPERYYPPLRDIAEAWIRNGARAYVADLRGDPVGTALAIRGGGVTGVYNVSVLRRARRMGIARGVMHRLLEDADDGLVTLQVTRGSVAERMYERLGFTRHYTWELWSTFV